MRISHHDFMQRMNQTLQDDAYDLFGEMLLERDVQNLLFEMQEEERTDAEFKMKSYFSSNESSHLQIILQHCHRSDSIKRNILRVWPKMFHIAALLVACVSLVGGIALANSPYIRIQLMKLLASTTPEYTELILSVEGEVDIPSNWYGHYYPRVTPENSSVVDWESDETYSCVYFSDESSPGLWNLSFTEYDGISDVRIDTENARKINSIINGYDVTIMEKDDIITIYWSDGQRLLLPQTQHCSLLETITYASNVVPIK